MKAPAFERNDLDKRQESSRSTSSKRRHVIACVDALRNPGKIVPYGVMAAKALNADLTLLHVIDTKSSNARAPFDPITSELLHRETCIRIEELALECQENAGTVRTVVLEGRPAEQICLWARSHKADLIIINMHQGESACGHEPGDTVRRVLGHAAGSVLLVPDDAPEMDAHRCQRIMAPLDGSSRAESALPLALRLAHSLSAELVLVHAVPEPEFTDIGPREPEDEELHQRLLRRNERVARTYLKRTRTRLADQAVVVSTAILSGGDPRHLLSRAIQDQHIDMVVMSSHGRGGHADMAAGSVASHLIAHAQAPLFVVREPVNEATFPVSDIPISTGLRFPHSQVA
jgi:nucleotide-binding universal stress UspA family protein